LHHHKIRLHDEIRDLDMEDEERRFKVLERDQTVSKKNWIGFKYFYQVYY
jgi:hypothetical protein